MIISIVLERNHKSFNDLMQGYKAPIETDIRCPKCKTLTVYVEQNIKDYPKILVVHTNRSEEDRNSLHQILSFEEYYETEGIKYELMGLVCFSGASLTSGGHYIAKVKVDGDWYHCSDSSV